MRGCIEHIVSLRLLCDMVNRKRLKLFVTFVDFSQAYDRVPRHVLFRVLQQLGCGSVMLCALVAIYTLTESVIGTSVILIIMGVRRGSPTSCLLIIIFVDELIKIIKGGCGPDGFFAVVTHTCSHGRHCSAGNHKVQYDEEDLFVARLLF